MEDNPIYKYLKEQGQTDLNESDFVTKYTDRKNLKGIYDYLREEGNTDLDFEPFAEKYFPLKKQEEVSTQGSQNTSQTSTEPTQPSLADFKDSWFTTVDGTATFRPTPEQEKELGGFDKLKDIFKVEYPDAVLSSSDGLETYIPSDDPTNQLADTTQTQPTFWSRVGDALMSIPSIFNESIYSIPEYVTNLASIPQNLIADAIENNAGEGTANWLRTGDNAFQDIVSATTGEAGNPLNYLNPLFSISIISEDAKQKQEYYNSRMKFNEDDIITNFSNGNYSEGGAKMVTGIIQSVPSMVSMAMTGGVSRVGQFGNVARTALNALPFASSKYQELKDNTNLSEQGKLIVSGFGGISEIMFEQAFGTGKLIDDIVTGKASRNNVQQFVTGYIDKLLQSNAIPAVMFRGGISEASTEITNNIIAKYSGEDPNRDLMSGVTDAFVIGSVADGAIGSVQKASDFIINKKRKTSVETLESEIAELQTDLDNPNIPETVKDQIQETIETKTNSINEEVSAEKSIIDSLTPEQAVEIADLNKQVSDIDNTLSQPESNISESTVTSLEERKVQLQDEIESLLEPAQEEKVTSSITPGQKTSFFQDLTNSENRTNRINQLEERMKAFKISDSGLGIAQDPKRQAEYMRDLTEYAVLRIVDGTVNTAKAFSEFISNINSNITEETASKAYNDAVNIAKEYAETNPNELNIEDRQGTLIVDIQQDTTTPKATTKITASKVKELTEGKIQGKVTITNKQALKTQIQTLNRGIRDGKLQVKEAREPINQLLRDLTDPNVFKGKINSSAVRVVANAINNANTPKQIERALTILDKVAEDIEFSNQLANMQQAKSRIRRLSKSKSTPADLKTVLANFARINPNDLEPTDLFTYAELANDIANREKTISTVSNEQLQKLIDLANSNREQRTEERKSQKGTDEAKQANIVKLKEKLINDLGADSSVVQDIDNGTKPFDEVISELQEKIDEYTESREDKVRQTARDYESAIKNDADNIRESLETNLEKKFFDEFINEDITEESIPKSMLGGYITSLYNLLNNNSVVGLGKYVNQSRVTDNVKDEGLVKTVMEFLRSPSTLFRKLNKGGAASGSVVFQQILKDTRNIGQLHSFTGFDNVQQNSVKAFTKIENILKEAEAVSKKYTKDLTDPVDNTVASIYADVVQYRQTWDAEQIRNEYALRIKAWGDSYERLVVKAEKNKDFASDNSNLLTNLKKALDIVANKSEVDGKQVYTPKFDDSADLFNKLPRGQQEYYKHIRAVYDSLRDDHFAVSRIFGGLDVEGDWVNYVPRSYNTIATSGEKAIARQLANSGGRVEDMLDGSFSGSLTKENTGSGQTRLISGDRLPLNSFLSPDFMNNFIREVSATIYDIETMGDRQFTAQMLDFERNGLIKDITDELPLELYKEKVAQKIFGDRAKVRFNVNNSSGINYLMGKIGKLGTAQALGGTIQFIKQTTPIIEVLSRVSPKSFSETMALMTNSPKEVGNIISKGDIVLRDISNEYDTPKSPNTQMSQKDMNGVMKALRKAGLKLDELTEKSVKASLAPLQITDNFVARIGWFAFYVDQTKRNNEGVIDLSKVDSDAISYANTQNSTVMNESDSSLQGQFSKKDWVRMMFPFSSFSINSKIALLTTLDKLRKATSASERARYSAELGGNLGNIIAFNAIGYGIRTVGISIGGYFLANAISGSDIPDEDKEKLLKELGEVETNKTQLNGVRSVGYLTQDLMFGGLFGRFTEPMFEPLTDKVLEWKYGEAYLEDIGYSKNKLFTNNSWIEDALSMTGTYGVFGKKVIDTYKIAGDLFESDEDYVTRRFRELNAEKDGIVVNPYRLDESHIDEYAVPQWQKATQATNFLISAISLTGLSGQEVNTIGRSSSTIGKALMQKEHGTVSKQSVEELVKSSKKLKSLNYNGYSIPLDMEQKTNYFAIRAEQVGLLKNRYERKRSKLTAEEFEKYISTLADKKTARIFVKKYPEIMKEAKVLKKDKAYDEKKELKQMKDYENKLNGK